MIDDIDRSTSALREAAGRVTVLPAVVETMRTAATDAVVATDPEDVMRAALRLLVAVEDVAKQAGSAVQALRSALCQAIVETGAPAVVAGPHLATVATSAPSVRITDLAALPEKYTRIVKEPDKTALAKALRAGESIPGATLNNPAPHLRIQTREATR